jgi:hypothetical protein
MEANNVVKLGWSVEVRGLFESVIIKFLVFYCRLSAVR